MPQLRQDFPIPYEEEKIMGRLTLISIGLSDALDMSLRALEEAKACDRLYAELYTTVLNTGIAEISSLIGKPVTQLRRSDLEEDAERIIHEAEEKRVGILAGGDCLVATTHLTLLLDAKKRGIEIRVIHGSSILTAIAEMGLSPYHFGKTVTVSLPLLEQGEVHPPMSPYRVVGENLERGLHTLLLLDLDAEHDRYLSANEAMRLLLAAEEEEGEDIFTEETLVVGAARLGSESPTVKGGLVRRLLNFNFGSPSHVLIVPGRLHFMEEEALKLLASVSDEDLKTRVRYAEDLEARTEKYMKVAKKVLAELSLSPLPRTIDEERVREALGYAETYLKDADYYLKEGRKPSALASVCYCEGILDALRLLRLVNFEW
jgi:diphthine synthase